MSDIDKLIEKAFLVRPLEQRIRNIEGKQIWTLKSVRTINGDGPDDLGNINITGGGRVQSIIGGTGIGVDSTDPANPIVSATGGTGYWDRTTDHIYPTTLTDWVGILQNTPLTPLHVGNYNVNNSVDAQIIVSRRVDDTVAGNGHAFSDSSYITRSGVIGYNSYDGRITVAGTNDYDHFALFQNAPVFAGTGTIANLYGFVSQPVDKANIVTNVYGVKVKNPAPLIVSGKVYHGTVINNYGYEVEDQTFGIHNWGIKVNVTNKPDTATAISAVSDYSAVITGTVKVTSTAHGLATGTTCGIVIAGTTDYNGTFIATYIDANNFYITAPYTTSQAGTWIYSSRIPIEIYQATTGDAMQLLLNRASAAAGDQHTINWKASTLTEAAIGAELQSGGTSADFVIETSTSSTLAEAARFKANKDLAVIGNITANNLSGTNTGDQNLSGYELLSNKSTSTSLGTSDTLYPSQNAVKSYVDTQTATKLTNPMTTLGDIIIENSTPAADRLAGNTTTTKKFLTQTGNGTNSAAPSWNTVAVSDVPDAANYRHIAFTIGDGTNAITTGINQQIAAVDNAGTLIGFYLVACDAVTATSGSLTVDVLRHNAGSIASTSTDSMVGAATKPNMSSATYAYFNNFTSWTSTTLAANDVIMLNVTAATTVKKVTVVIVYKITG